MPVPFEPEPELSTEEELDMVYQAMAPKSPFERGDRPGRPSGEGGGGGVGVPQSLENALSGLAQGRMNSKQVQDAFRQEGWGVNLRTRSGVEVVDPNGKVHWIPNGWF